MCLKSLSEPQFKHRSGSQSLKVLTHGHILLLHYPGLHLHPLN